MRINLIPVMLVCICVIDLNAAHAQQQSQNNSGLIVRAYNVSDLIRLSSDYPLESRITLAGGSLLTPSPSRGGGGGNLYSPPQPAPVVGPNVAPLMDLITRSVEPDSWAETGGRISSLGSTLVVRQTADNQNRIQQLLDELRKANGPAQIVTVHMTWVLCAPRELPDPKTEVTADWINKQKAYCESQITCFSGQTVHIMTGQSRQVISDLTPVIATGAVAFDPTMSSVLSGILLQVTPQIVPGNDTAILDVQTIVNQAGAPDEAKPLSATARSEGANGTVTQYQGSIDRMTTISQEFKTTARLPMKKKVIVGGMTLDPSSGGDHAGQQLYLIAEIDSGK